MIILVTGATAGFGESITRRFVANGHKVIATGRRQERLQELKDELGDSRTAGRPQPRRHLRDDCQPACRMA